MTNVRSELSRWVEAGLIDSSTAVEIEEFESRRPASRVGRGIEAVAYLGAVLVLVALGLLTLEYWDRLEAWGRVSLSALVFATLLVLGTVLGRSQEPAIKRGQTFAWLLAIGALFLTGYVASSEWVTSDGGLAFLWASASALATALALWWMRRSVLQMTALGLTTAMTAAAALSQIDGIAEWSYGLVFAGLGASWLILTWAGVFQPTRTSYVLGGIGVLFIAFPEGSDMPWPVLGLVAGLALMLLSVWLDQTVLLGLGVAGLFVYIPMTIFEWFGDSLGVPVAMLITGLILLGLVLFSVRLRQ